MERIIFHSDCNGFYASVEEQIHPEYKQVPMAVCGDPKNRRGIILAKNEKAKAYHIQTAETVWQALKKCPNLVLAPPRHTLYGEYSDVINQIYQDYSDLVEPVSIDESYLDVTGSLHLFARTAEELAHTIRKRVQRETGITVSIGVSYNKIFAKLGSDYKKPNAVTVISKDNYKNILWPLPASRMYMVGSVTAEKLQQMGVRTIEQLATTPESELQSRLGKVGNMLHRFANGLDDSLVLSSQEREEVSSIGNGMTFRRNLENLQDIQTGISALADSVAARLRASNLKCTTVQVTIKNPDLKSISRQATFEIATWLAREISHIALEIVLDTWKTGNPIRMLTVTATNLLPANEATEQLSLFGGEAAEQSKKRHEALEMTMDSIRKRYGSQSLKLGSVVDNDLGIHKGE